LTRPLAAILADLDQRDLLVDFTHIARKHGVLLAEIMGPRRAYGGVGRARRDCWRLLRERGWSYPSIGALWGVDHSSVMYGVRKAIGAEMLAELKRGAA
jgi:chromosomal replication initiation ATPase DnaA